MNNAVVFGIRRSRFQEDDAVRFLNVLDTIPLIADVEIARHDLGHRILRLGLSYGFSAYDASYLELAMRRDCRSRPRIKCSSVRRRELVSPF